LSSELLSNHVTHDTHHSSTAVVKFGIELAGLLLWVLDVGTEVTNSVVSVVLGSWEPGELDESHEGDDLGKTSGGDSEKSINTGGDIRELKVVGWGDVSVVDNVVVVDDGSNNGSHGNTSVLALNGTTTLEGLRLGLHPSERIENTKGLSGSKLELTDLKAGRSLNNRKRERNRETSRMSIVYRRGAVHFPHVTSLTSHAWTVSN